MRTTFCLLFVGLLVSGCATDGGTDPEDETAGARFSARIDGVPWVAAETTARINGAPGGLFVISGYTTQGPITGIGITLTNITGVGTYPLGVGPTVFGGGASVAVDGAQWVTPESGAAGTITLTQVAPDRLVGTFSFSAASTVSPSGAAKTVTDGSFDLPVTALGGIAVQDHQGSRVSATIGGAEWNAANVVTERITQQNRLNVLAINSSYTVGVLVSQYTGAGTYSVNTPTRYVSVSQGSRSWGGSDALSSGTVTVTSSTTTRVRGSFNLSLRSANPANGTIAVTGTFDLGLPNP